ncbi:MAG: hypothetical protein E6K73_08005 [Candidatus Eisenbacteria bacterium]|uniref:Uncharacterized protein n=1 Tax=Eiseniibacteriota bacterium TaxID=2212470 RepID=A0A538SFZ5_UNCEI|nr:MAG: hypothetical protein E6K73_08005 [Candidatus Eisenbacteria bacterium]
MRPRPEEANESEKTLYRLGPAEIGRRVATEVGTEDTMDHYTPKRRIPVTLWSEDVQGASGQIFLDLGTSGGRHQTILEKLNESSPFLPVVIGQEGRIHLFSRQRLTRITPGRQVLQSDVFARGFQPWREERVDVSLTDGTRFSGRVWTPLERETQRLSDFMNQQGAGFFVLITPAGLHLVNAGRVAEMALAESVGAPLSSAPSIVY